MVVWPCVENGRSFRLNEYLVLLWLTINSLVFDYRDIEGNSFVETQPIPDRLGLRNTIYLLIGLTAALVGVSAWLETRGFVNPLMPAILAGASAGVLLALVRRPCPMTISVLADLFSSPCDRRNLRLSIAACAALRLLLPQHLNFQTRDCLESVRHDKSGRLSVHGETEAMGAIRPPRQAKFLLRSSPW